MSGPDDQVMRGHDYDYLTAYNPDHMIERPEDHLTRAETGLRR
jgi:hypothetical protein